MSTHLTVDEKLALTLAIDAAISETLLPIGREHRDRGVCFNCYVRPEIAALSLALAMDIATVAEKLDAAGRTSFVAEVVERLTTQVLVNLAEFETDPLPPEVVRP